MLNEEQDYDDKMVVAMLRLDLLTAEEFLDVAMFSNGMDQYVTCVGIRPDTCKVLNRLVRIVHVTNSTFNTYVKKQYAIILG